MFMPSCILPVLIRLTAHQDQLNSSAPWSSQSEPAYSRGCTGWVPLIGTRSCSGRCYRSVAAAGRGEGRRGYSSWKERHPTGNGRPRYSGYDWRQRREGQWENRWWKQIKKKTEMREEERERNEVRKLKAWLSGQYILKISEKWAVPFYKSYHVTTFLFTHSFSFISSLTHVSIRFCHLLQK